VYALTNWHVVAGRDHNNQVVAPTAGDTEVGQPTNGSSSTQCCNDIVGTFAAGSMDGVRDAAAIKLVPGTRWQADIAEIGAVRGSHAIVEDDLDPGPYQVRKRGIRSGLTGGRVLSINSTYMAMGRIFRNAIIVRFDPDPGQPSGPQLYFAQRGDSGSALVNDANEVVGLMFAATLKGPDANAIGNAAAIPLEDVFDRFGDDGLTLRLATAPRPGVVRTVPGAVEQGTPAALAEPAAIPACVAGSERPSREDFVRLRADLERSAAGRRLTAAWLAHHHELLALVDKNRRVTVGWHRGGGPALVQLGLRALSDPDLTLPRTLRDRPLALIAETFTRYGSEPLRAAVADARAMLPDLAGRSYRQVIDGLDAG
jgi:hypothetical protein